MQNPSAVFQTYTLQNLNFWHQQIVGQKIDAVMIDERHPLIIKAISLTLHSELVWPDLCEIIDALAPAMERRAHWLPWSQILVQAVETITQPQARVKLLTLFARFLQRQGKDDQAISVHRQAIRSARAVGDQFSLARSCTNLGYLYIERQQLWRAEILCQYARHIFEALQSEYGCAHAENHLGFLYIRQKRRDCAQQHLEQAVDLFKRLDDKDGAMNSFMNLGVLFHEMKAPEAAMHYLNLALKYAQEVGEAVNIGQIYMNMGLIHQLNGDLPEAVELTKQAITIFRKYSHTQKLTNALENLAEFYFEQASWQVAMRTFLDAFELRQIFPNNFDEIQIPLFLAKCELAIQNFEQARHWLEIAEKSLNQARPSARNMRLPEEIARLRQSL